MSNPLTCKFILDGDKVNVEVKYTKKDKSSREKTIPLKDFILFIKNFDKDNLMVSDTGFMTNNLIRKAETVSTTHLFFYYNSITSNFNFNVPCYLDLSGVVPYFDGSPKVTYTNVLFHITYDKTSYVSRYTLYFLEPNLVGNVQLKDDTPLFKSFLPNSFGDSICWGSLIDSGDINKAMAAGNHEFISRLPALYLNSRFNTDLFLSAYGGRFSPFDSDFKTTLESVTRRYSEDLYNEILQISDQYELFKILLPFCMNEPELKPLFFQFLREGACRDSITTLKDLCDKHGI